jgi:hypothetical protein
MQIYTNMFLFFFENMLTAGLLHTAASLDSRTLPRALPDSRRLPHTLPHTATLPDIAVRSAVVWQCEAVQQQCGSSAAVGGSVWQCVR